MVSRRQLLSDGTLPQCDTLLDRVRAQRCSSAPLSGGARELNADGAGPKGSVNCRPRLIVERLRETDRQFDLEGRGAVARVPHLQAATHRALPPATAGTRPSSRVFVTRAKDSFLSRVASSRRRSDAS